MEAGGSMQPGAITAVTLFAIVGLPFITHSRPGGDLTPRQSKRPGSRVPGRAALSERRRPESNRRIAVLQTAALPLGYGAMSKA